MKLNKIKVYGKLRQDLGCSYFEAAVNSPLEALRFLRANFPDLENYTSIWISGLYTHISYLAIMKAYS